MNTTQKERADFTNRLNQKYEGLSDRQLMERQTQYQFKQFKEQESLNKRLVSINHKLYLFYVIVVVQLIWFVFNLFAESLIN